MFLLPAEDGFDELVGDERLALVEGGAQVGDVGQEAFDEIRGRDERRCVVGRDDEWLAAESLFFDA